MRGSLTARDCGNRDAHAGHEWAASGHGFWCYGHDAPAPSIEATQVRLNGEVWAEHGHPGIPCSPPEAVRRDGPVCRLVSVEATQAEGVKAVIARHRLTTPVQCSCGWRETDPDRFPLTWEAHVALALEWDATEREKAVGARALREAADDAERARENGEWWVPNVAWLRARAAGLEGGEG